LEFSHDERCRRFRRPRVGLVLETYSCVLNWFGQERSIEVIENEGEFPLLGVALLRDHRLTIDYPAGVVEIV
jgi:hypothetical protein